MIKKIYHQYAYGIMGTLIFHILLFVGLIFFNVENKGNVKEEAIILDFSEPKKEKEPEPEKEQEKERKPEPETKIARTHSASSNRAVNDSRAKDKFFDEDYMRDVRAAQQLAKNVNKQLQKQIPSAKDFKMPVVTTAGQKPDEISNTIYSGESNIHYFLKDRYHVRLPIPVYLARSGGVVTVSIWVDREGNVVKAEVQKNSGVSDPLLFDYAQSAALGTVFNADDKAPKTQSGTITYTFVAQ